VRAIIAVILAALFAAAVALWFQGLDGYVVAVIPPYRAQISLQLLMLLAIFLVLVGYVGLRLVVRLVTTPEAVRHWQQRRRLQQALVALERGVTGSLLGKPKGSFRALERCHRLGHGAPIAAVTAFEAALAVGDEAQAENALARVPDGQEWGSVKRVLEARFGLTFQRSDRLEAALAALATDRQVAPSVRERLRLQAGQQKGDWPQALEAARSLYRHRLLTSTDWHQVVGEAYPVLVLRALASGEPIAAWWQTLPKEDQRDPEVAAAVVRTLIAAGHPKEAVAIAEPLLAHQCYSKLLAALMPALPADNRWLERLEGWSRGSADPIVLEALLRTALALRLFGKAKGYFAELQRLDPERARQVAGDWLLNQGGAPMLWDEATPLRLPDAQCETAHTRSVPTEPPEPTSPPVAAEATADTESRGR
jgi:HemY protein